MENQAAITFDNVAYSKNEQTIIDGISGVIPKIKITALIGPSGAGKTTVLKLCNGLLSQTAGNIFIESRSIDEFHPQKLRRHVGLALQEAPMIDGNVRKNLTLPLALRQEKVPEAEIEQLLELVGLNKELLQRHVRHLSGGQKQKLALARTLLNRPPILLLDEITSSLDQVSVSEIEQLIMTINEKYEATIVWITHDIEQAKKVAEYVWVLMNGKLIESGPVRLIDEPQEETTKKFLRGIKQ